MAGILVFGEIGLDGLQSITSELLAAARNLSESSGDDVAVALLGSGADAVSQEAIALGADKI